MALLIVAAADGRHSPARMVGPSLDARTRIRSTHGRTAGRDAGDGHRLRPESGAWTGQRPRCAPSPPPGVDGKAAASVVFYTREERERVSWRVRADAAKDVHRQAQAQSKMQSFEAVTAYCETVDRCRHRLIAEYFGDESVVCEFACDFCKEGGALLGRQAGGEIGDEVRQRRVGRDERGRRAPRRELGGRRVHGRNSTGTRQALSLGASLLTVP